MHFKVLFAINRIKTTVLDIYELSSTKTNTWLHSNKLNNKTTSSKTNPNLCAFESINILQKSF